ncbi:uncharacterized protein LOC106644172 [Copidosoma floridanum]|uniref:uncharacterized protein LOC106644172 n=1 Tax=Copidosoma floridanum TaxID=29053 RepID=UPI0006C9DB5C|nr:uncharacterized protein LOC106644172 [Copidosoma floridanum]
MSLDADNFQVKGRLDVKRRDFKGKLGIRIDAWESDTITDRLLGDPTKEKKEEVKEIKRNKSESMNKDVYEDGNKPPPDPPPPPNSSSSSDLLKNGSEEGAGKNKAKLES